jgi:DUF1009 family protein
MLALVAGRGDLPAAVAAQANGPVLVCALDGQVPVGLVPDIVFRLETLGTFLLSLAERGVDRVCFCGGIDRPVIDPARIDAETAPLVPLLSEALAAGDDGALRVVVALFERTGFTVVGAHQIAPSLVMQADVPTRRGPQASHRADTEAGLAILAQMGAADLGQACVIRRGAVIAREGVAGTDAMLATLFEPGVTLPEPGAETAWLAALDDRVDDAGGLGGILLKGPKPGQERRADLPTIGPRTALSAAAAGLDGIVIEAGGVIVLDQPGVIRILDQAEMFLWVR